MNLPRIASSYILKLLSLVIITFYFMGCDGEDFYATEPFITTWKTDNEGFSGSNEIHIQISGEGYDYNYTVDWGDGFVDENISGSITHTYDVPGIYTVRVTGVFPALWHWPGNTSDAKKLLTVEQWGDQRWAETRQMFMGSENIRINANDVPDLSEVETMTSMFRLASSFNSDISDWDVSNVEDTWTVFKGAVEFNQDISSWDVSNITDMRGMFSGAVSFDQDLGAWNITSVENMEGMFEGVTLSTENYDGILIGWSAQSVKRGVIFDAGNSQYSPAAQAARDTLTNAFGWTILDGGVSE